MIRFCIVEDNLEYENTLKEYIASFSKEQNFKYEINIFSNAEDFLLLQAYPYDIIIMDIELNNVNGMDAVRSLRERGFNNLVIFCTILAHYAVNGYSVNAFDFMVKPINYNDFTLKMLRALTSLNTSKEKNILLSLKGDKVTISTSNILYVEVDGHKVSYHMNNGNIYTLNSSMKVTLENLANLPFALCNQCYLVNLRYVDRIDKTFCYIKGESLLISAPKRKPFLQALNNYLNKVNL